MAGNGLNEPPVAQRTRGPHPAVREIHKNAWLKRQTSNEKKGTPFTKKGEKFWVVFCVHDDVEAFLEFYSEPKMGTIHKPISAVSLNSCLHVSPSIVGQDNEYQFAVTLQTEVIRLVACNWDQMIEWVESLQGKLREMNILCPKDNLYSKLPETKLMPGLVASTRDPNSPLPPTPSSLAGSSAPSRPQNQNTRSEQSHRALELANSSREVTESNNIANHPSRLSMNGNTSASNHGAPERENLRTTQSTSDALNGSSRVPSTSHQQPTVQSVLELSQDDPNVQPKRKQQISVKVNLDVTNGHRSSTNATTQAQLRHHSNAHSSSASSTSASTTVVVIGSNDVRIQNGHSSDISHHRNGCPSAMSVTINGLPTTTADQNHFSEEAENNHLEISQRDEQNHQEDQASSTSTNPCVTTVAVNYPKYPRNNPAARSRQRNEAASNETESKTENGSIVNPMNKAGKSTSSENIYEHIYIPDRMMERNGTKQALTNGNHKVRSQILEEGDIRVGSRGSCQQRSPEGEGIPHDSHARRMMKSASGGSSHRSSSLGRIENPPTSSRCDHHRDENSRRNGNRNRHGADLVHSVGNSTFFSANNGSPSQLQGNPIDCLIGSRNGEYRLRRDEYLLRMGETPNDNQSNDISQSNDQANMPLKEQQVMHLQREINHPGGVRIVLRKKDCLSSMAFVDYLGAVWIAGWKQTQFPVLYYAFHVGDQILKVAGVTVQSSVEASRAIKMVSSMQVEFIIRRLPYGKVFALKRSRDGEPLGLVAEGGSGEISEVLPDGLAARYGLPPKGLSVDGQTPCNWYLTEVNNRPLSLMSKENEVKDRLNAVGKEISILVQPADLVKHLRKSLKSYKGFKDYVVG